MNSTISLQFTRKVGYRFAFLKCFFQKLTQVGENLLNFATYANREQYAPRILNVTVSMIEILVPIYESKVVFEVRMWLEIYINIRIK